jgi:capsular exopolysaccharide synthesis family protein
MSNDNEYEQGQVVNDDLSIKELFKPLWNRRWLIIFITLLITSLVAFYMASLKPSYKATSLLQIGSNKPSNTLSINEAFNETSASTEQIHTQYELLRSKKFAERVIGRLNLIDNTEFSSGKYKEDSLLFGKKNKHHKVELDYIILAFQQRLLITPIRDTELVKISFIAYDPKLAQNVANQIGLTYLEYQDEVHSASKETTSQWLVDQLEELGQKLEISEQALQNFREQEQIVDIRGVVGLISTELTTLTSSSLQVSKLSSDLKLTALYINQHKNDVNKLVELAEISKSPIYLRLRNSEELVERKLSEISKRYGPKHPKRIANEAELKSIRARITQQIKDLAYSIEKEYLSSLDKVKTTNERVAVAKMNFLRLSRLENKFSQLQREVDTNKELYNTYLIRLKEADAMGNYKADFYVRFIDKAVAPKFPFKPNKTIFTLAAMVMSALLISIIIIMRELMLDTLNSRRKLDAFTDASILAVLPKFKEDKKKSNNAVVDKRYTESMRTLRTALLFNYDKKPPKIIAITSSEPGEGKSTTALELARSFSEMEKVLLIEGDMRHPTIAKNLHLDPNKPGLSNLLAKTHQINECITRDEHIKLDILTSGITPSNPLAFLSMKRFSMLIKVFGNFYDRIIIETPPVNAVSDAVIVSRLVDSVIYVVHSGKTKREQISMGLRLLRQVNAPVTGIVVNQSENIDTTKYQNKYYSDMANIIKLPIRKKG